MDLQNVNDLAIPEGEVRSIQDKNNMKLWGKLTYATTYLGNTIQDGTPSTSTPIAVQNVSGVQNIIVYGGNLFNKNGSILNDQYLRNDGTISSPQSGWAITDYISINSNTDYTMSGISSGFGNNPSRCYYDVNKTFISGKKHSSATTKFTDKSPIGACYMRESIRSIDVNTIQIEEGQSISPYESFQSANYSIDLGNIELCKIGNYQDYIYKSGSDWYVYKACGKVVLDGSSDEDWAVANSGTANFFYRYRYINYSTQGLSAISNNFTWASIVNSTTNPGFMLINTNQARFRPDFSELSIDDWKVWLSTHNTTVYYPLATATDTQITDATLVGQLDAIHQFLTRYGYSATVSGNLPLIIDKTNL